MRSLLVIFFLFACGGDDDTSSYDGSADRTAGDASVDAAPRTCADYCACMTSYCVSTVFPGNGDDAGPGGDAGTVDCLTFCETFSPTQLECRTDHCGYAETDPSPAAGHCRHAIGIDMCQL